MQRPHLPQPQPNDVRVPEPLHQLVAAAERNRAEHAEASNDGEQSRAGPGYKREASTQQHSAREGHCQPTGHRSNGPIHRVEPRLQVVGQHEHRYAAQKGWRAGRWRKWGDGQAGGARGHAHACAIDCA
eukprot:349602-Chlamydomonas_euryale.AAC.7